MSELQTAAARIAVALYTTCEAVEEFSRRYWKMAITCYLAYHRRLPGSERTARLRKKRRTIVLNWFADWLAVHNHPPLVLKFRKGEASSESPFR